MAKVLVVGGGLQGVSTARSLADAGHTVGLWAPPKDFAHKSTAVSLHGFGWLAEGLEPILEFMGANCFDAAIPMTDDYAHLLSTNSRRIKDETGCVAAVPALSQLEAAADKPTLMEICERAGLPHPRTVRCSASDSADISALNYPVVVKPDHSVGARGITKVDNPSGLAKAIATVTQRYGSCHVQEYVESEGPYYNVMIYRDRNGRQLAHAVLEIIRYYPLQAGSSSMCRTIDDPELVDICMKALGEIGYVGFADFDVLRSRQGEYKIIEINPRVPASLRGAAVSGVNFPAIITADALGLPIPKCTYEPAKILRYLGLDILWFISSPDRFRSRPGWFRFWGRNVFYQEGGRRDWRAMIAAFLENFNKLEFKGGRIRKKDH